MQTLIRSRIISTKILAFQLGLKLSRAWPRVNRDISYKTGICIFGWSWVTTLFWNFYLGWPWSSWWTCIPKFLEQDLQSTLIWKFLSGLKFDRAMINVIKAGLAIVIMITVGDYCSMTTGVLQISTTTKNSRPEN